MREIKSESVDMIEVGSTWGGGGALENHHVIQSAAEKREIIKTTIIN